MRARFRLEGDMRPWVSYRGQPHTRAGAILDLWFERQRLSISSWSSCLARDVDVMIVVRILTCTLVAADQPDCP